MKMKQPYVLFQVKEGMTRDFGWMGLEERQEVLGTDKIDLNVYTDTYNGGIELTDADYGYSSELNKLYHMFNIEHPEDFTGRSMSVGDIVQLGGRFWYCDSIGFTDVTDKIVV